MPWMTRANIVYKKKGKKLIKKATAKSPARAKKMVRLLRAIEFGGFKPRRRK